MGDEPEGGPTEGETAETDSVFLPTLSFLKERVARLRAG